MPAKGHNRTASHATPLTEGEGGAYLPPPSPSDPDAAQPDQRGIAIRLDGIEKRLNVIMEALGKVFPGQFRDGQAQSEAARPEEEKLLPHDAKEFRKAIDAARMGYGRTLRKYLSTHRVTHEDLAG
jgi:hypothetical protein